MRQLLISLNTKMNYPIPSLISPPHLPNLLIHHYLFPGYSLCTQHWMVYPIATPSCPLEVMYLPNNTWQDSPARPKCLERRLFKRFVLLPLPTRFAQDIPRRHFSKQHCNDPVFCGECLESRRRLFDLLKANGLNTNLVVLARQV